MFFKAVYTKGYIDKEFLSREENFIDYFLMQKKEIEEKIKNRDKSFMKDFDVRLKQVFKNYQKPLMYRFYQKGEFFYFEHYFGRNSYLLTLGDELCKEINKKLDNWRFLNLRSITSY